PHTQLSNLADPPPPALYAPTFSIPDSASSFPHRPTGKSRRHTIRCVANYFRLFPPTPRMNHSDRAPPNQSNTLPRHRTPESTSSHHLPSSRLLLTPRPRNTRTCSADSRHSTSRAPKRPPAQSAETSARKKCRPSSRQSSPPWALLSSHPSFDLSRS